MTPEERASHNEARTAQAKRLRLNARRAGPVQYAARDPTNKPAEHYIGERNGECKACHALHFRAEAVTRGHYGGSCCNNGNVVLPPLQPYTEPLYSWLTKNDSDSKHFKNNVRKYNGAFGFATFGYQSQHFTSGPQTFAIHGQTYHLTSTSATPARDQAQFSQLYFLDPEFATTARLSNPHNRECNLRFMAEIESHLRAVNPYADAFKMMRDLVQTRESHSIEMWIVKDRTKDPRRYNLPIANEVAAVFVSEDGQPDFNRDICIYPKNNQTTTNMSIVSPNLDPMVYPILFPRGDKGWQPNYLGENGKKVTFLQFYNYRLQERHLYFNPLLHAGKLTQQYIVDAYMKVEGDKLGWLRHNQSNLRVESYLGLLDYVQNQAEKQHLKPGKVFILPSSFLGGKRYMAQNYQDAMVMVAAFGKPDLFITFTCNPNWKEIKENLKPGETSLDRPDLVATVFHLKLEEFIHDMCSNHVLGKVKAFLYVIEFQKRGLPHCHMLFILENDDKLREPEEVDKVVCAEIPDKEEDPVLYDIVSTAMIHGPCGPHDELAPCMEDVQGKKVCMKKFPKEFCNKTCMENNGYPEYARRKNGRSVTKRVKGKEIEMDNRWVVPYNPYLTRKYNAHINVEVCSSVKSVKYIFKYIYKGHDAAVIKVNEKGEGGSLHWDEIKTYLDTRYIAAPEAIWRLRKYKLQKRSHTVVRLAVHLDNMFAKVFNEDNAQKALQDAAEQGTTLTNWFRLNKEHPEARQYLYTEIPLHYRYEKHEWIPRKANSEKILPRMYAVSPKDPERFALRLLLLHVRGAQSFEELCVVNGHDYGKGNFVDAARALNLLEDTDTWNKTLDEACVFQMPSQLRLLFAVILVFGEPSDKKKLYEKYKEQMMEDYLHRFSEEESEHLMLRDLDEHLMQNKTSCKENRLPSFNPMCIPAVAQDTDDQITHNQHEVERLLPQLNEEQKQAFDAVINSVEGRSHQKCFFLSGAGGSGKTFLYKALSAYVRAQGWKVKAVAPTGLASTLLPDGTTVHSGFGLPLDLTSVSVSRFTQGSNEWRILLQTKLIIWDEISMCSKDMLEVVDRSLRDLLNSNLLFGGITIVVGGDFRQQAPVVLHGNRVKVVEACAKFSRLWRHFVELKLIRNMRVNPDEVEFVEWLLKIGSGQNASGQASEFLQLPDEILTEDIVTAVFGENINALSREDIASRAILSPKNESTMLINECILAKLEGEETSFLSIDTVSSAETEEERQMYPVEFLNSMTPMGMPPHKLNLKVGCCVMLLRNMNTKQGLCNGTRLIVEEIRPNLIYCSIFSGAQKGSRVFIPRMFVDTKGSELGFEMRRKQFPLRLAYSMTITKAQGQTFEKIGVYLPQPVFTHGQVYTGFSRVTSKSGLSIQVFPGQSQGQIYEHDNATYTFNCVYPEILV